ncbi:hypothetical protein PGTUg99_030005 [Puccinia graminis f. sp. tritici]|uniref:Uncharacterized protein n=1 Tax=Puccinia graminis f. sp. tritici TaxID=56615 RepID=A0A5B0S6M2_PUCGR|nr:hypothetical protein PGTUg99_030005 [Puccinia graminis f. sp. tritici]
MSVPSRKEVTANDAADGLFTVFEENFLLTAVTAIEAADRLFTEVELKQLFGVEAAQESFEEVAAIKAEDRLFTEFELEELFGVEAAQDPIEEVAAIEVEDRLFTELELKELFGVEVAQYLIEDEFFDILFNTGIFEGYITRGNMEHIHNTLSNKYGFSGALKIDYIETPQGQLVSSNVLFRPMLQEWMRSDPPFDNVEHYFPDYVAFRSMDHDVDNTGEAADDWNWTILFRTHPYRSPASRF